MRSCCSVAGVVPPAPVSKNKQGECDDGRLFVRSKAVPNPTFESPIKESPRNALDKLVNRSRIDAESTFYRYDKDRDGYLSKEDLFDGFKELELGLTPEMYRHCIDCNFKYADMDGDGRLTLEEFLVIHGMIGEVRRKFTSFDTDEDGLINKTDFTHIVQELNLDLDEAMCRSYVDLNFRYVDRSFRGTISFGQFLACYANFLISHSIMHHKESHDGRLSPVARAPAEVVGAPVGVDATIVDLIDDGDDDDDDAVHRIVMVPCGPNEVRGPLDQAERPPPEAPAAAPANSLATSSGSSSEDFEM